MRVKCVGERRCGNHLLQDVLDENWGEHLTTWQGEYMHLPYLPDYAKHDPSAWDAVAIAVKRPAPWLASMMEWEEDGPGTDKRWRAELCRWVKTYGNYLEHFGEPGERDDVVWARYEDFVRAPRDTVLRWGVKLTGVSAPHSGVWLPGDHCSPATGEQEGSFDLAYYRGEAWREELPEKALKAVRQWFSHETTRGVFDAIYPDAEPG